MTGKEGFSKLRKLCLNAANFLIKLGTNVINADGTLESYYLDTKKAFDETKDSFIEITNKNE